VFRTSETYVRRNKAVKFCIRFLKGAVFALALLAVPLSVSAVIKAPHEAGLESDVIANNVPDDAGVAVVLNSPLDISVALNARGRSAVVLEDAAQGSDEDAVAEAENVILDDIAAEVETAEIPAAEAINAEVKAAEEVPAAENKIIEVPAAEVINAEVPAAEVTPAEVTPAEFTPYENTAAKNIPPGVTVIGDSVALSAKQMLTDTIDGCHVEAKVSQGISGGFGVFEELLRRGEVREYVVIALGTNSSGKYEELLTKFIDALGTGHRLVFVTPYDGRDNQNAETVKRTAAWERELPGRYDFITIADWNAIISKQTHLLSPDLVHLGGDTSARLFAGCIAEALETAAIRPAKR
jgi:hypothetical protein